MLDEIEIDPLRHPPHQQGRHGTEEPIAAQVDQRPGPKRIEKVGPVDVVGLVLLDAITQCPKVERHAADQLVDEKTGEGYFRVDLKIPPQELVKLPKGDKLSPGMPAETMIVTGNRSILSYVVSPLTDTIRDALRED